MNLLYVTKSDSHTVEAYQRVLLDIFHFMDRYKVKKLHPLYLKFMGMLRDAIFMINSEDWNALKAFYLARGFSEQQFYEIPHSKLLSNNRIRRRIPSKEELAERVDAVIDLFRSIDPSFITDSVLKAHQNGLKHINMGCLSDHPEVQLYFEVSGSDSNSPLLRCARGSSQQEGFHFYVFDSTAGKTISPQLFDPMLAELVHRWNWDRAVKAGLQGDFGCYDIELFEALHKLIKTNPQLFQGYNPLSHYVPIIIDERPLERFGCSRVVGAITDMVLAEDERENDTQYLDAEDSADLPDIADEVLENAINSFQPMKEVVTDFTDPSAGQAITPIIIDTPLRDKIMKHPQPQGVSLIIFQMSCL